MKTFSIIVLIQLLVLSVHSFRMFNSDCEWFGTSPSCGSSGSSLGDIDSEDRKYVASTRCQTRLAACYAAAGHSSGRSYDDCVNAYGSGCWSGYKRLWCKCDNRNSCYNVPYGGDGCDYLKENTAFQFFNQFTEKEKEKESHCDDNIH
ncbi:unnamed protein product [Cunninghamella echinulata]